MVGYGYRHMDCVGVCKHLGYHKTREKYKMADLFICEGCGQFVIPDDVIRVRLDDPRPIIIGTRVLQREEIE